jgi:hypothetical protein
MTSHRNKWSKLDIRNARRANIHDVLIREGIKMRESGGGNYELIYQPGLILKDCFWNWPKENLHGNAIDLFVNVFGKSFHQAMCIITKHSEQ